MAIKRRHPLSFGVGHNIKGKNAMDNFLDIDISFELAASWLQKILKALYQIKKNKESKIDKIADVFGDPIQLAKYYIESDCQQFNPADDEDEDTHIVREPIFRYFAKFFSGDKIEGKHQIFLLSDAGMGKTSLLVMLKLAHLTSLLPKGYECILIKLNPNTIENLKKIEGKRNKILLLDALDEDSSAWGRVNDRIIELLKETYNFKRVIITCRTQFFSAGEDPFDNRGRVAIGGFLCPVIYNSLFNEYQTNLYIKKRFGKRKDYDQIQDKSKNIIKKMGSLKFRPMLLSHIEDLIESENKVWNEYSIYETLIKGWLMREQRKRLARDKNVSSPSLDELLRACNLLALYLQKTERREIPQKELYKLIDETPEINQIPKMDIAGRSLLNKNSSGAYRFSHYSIQEFLLVNASLKGLIKLKAENITTTSLMNQFFISWLADSNRSAGTSEDFSSIYDLSNAKLEGVNLSGINLEGANLQKVNFKNANLTNTRLQWAKIMNSDLRGANLTNAKIHWANFTGAKYDKNTIFPKGVYAEGLIFIDD